MTKLATIESEQLEIVVGGEDAASAAYKMHLLGKGADFKLSNYASHAYQLDRAGWNKVPASAPNNVGTAPTASRGRGY
jgi:hypothetical protein